MKKTIKNIAFAVMGAVALGTTGCSDFLDKQPSADLTEEKTFADWNMFNYFHTDTYNFLRHGACPMSNSWLDAATDLAETSIASSGARTSFNIGNYYAGGGTREFNDTWESRYRGIRKCNRVINQIDKVPYDITKSDEENISLRKVTVAEARTFRAFFYWEMFLRFGPLPIVTDVLDPDQDMITPYTERPTTKEYVVDFILKEPARGDSRPAHLRGRMGPQPRRPLVAAYGQSAGIAYPAVHGIAPLCCRERHHLAGGCSVGQGIHRRVRWSVLPL